MDVLLIKIGWWIFFTSLYYIFISICENFLLEENEDE